MTIRQNTRRTAFAMFRRGFSVSDAALHESEALQLTSSERVRNELTSQRAPSLGRRNPPARGQTPNLGSDLWTCF
jgi:hypothetical protein